MFQGLFDFLLWFFWDQTSDQMTRQGVAVMSIFAMITLTILLKVL